LLCQRHRRLIVAGKHPDTTFLTQPIKRRIYPSQALDIVWVYTNSDTHTRFTHPDVVCCEIRIEVEVFKNLIIRA
jgi:hypothetical protein